MDGPGNFAIDHRGNIWVGNNYTYSRKSREPTCFGRTLFRFTPTGRTYPGSPYESGGTSGVGFGITIDKRSHVWIGNFGFKGAGCEEEQPANSVSEYKLNGEALSPDLVPTGKKENEKGEILKTYKGGWEVGDIFWPQATVADVNNNVWVANFSGRRLSVLCGTRPRSCPAGRRRTGASISPRKTGYGFDGLVRSTGVAVDPSGNVWLTNNWKNVPIPTNPGGYQIVAYLGLAAPIKTPLIGQPEQP